MTIATHDNTQSAVMGVMGRWTHRTTKPGQAPGLWFKQIWKSVKREVTGYGGYGGYGEEAFLSVKINFDDDCGNGHNTFAITGDIRSARGRDIAGGCLHDDIAKVFPELAPLIKWHLTSSDSPMHYVANAVYLAGDLDHNGLRKGEKRQIKNGKSGLPCWILEPVNGEAEEYVDAITPPASPLYHYAPLCREGEGKERDFAAARSCAVWPEATDEQLSLPKAELEALLVARLPQLQADFKAAMIAAGFIWEPEAIAA